MLEKNQESLLRDLMVYYFVEGLDQYTQKIQQMSKVKLKNEIAKIEKSWQKGRKEIDAVNLCLTCYYYEKQFNENYRLKGEARNAVNAVFNFVNIFKLRNDGIGRAE